VQVAGIINKKIKKSQKGKRKREKKGGDFCLYCRGLAA